MLSVTAVSLASQFTLCVLAVFLLLLAVFKRW